MTTILVITIPGGAGHGMTRWESTILTGIFVSVPAGVIIPIIIRAGTYMQDMILITGVHGTGTAITPGAMVIIPINMGTITAITMEVTAGDMRLFTGPEIAGKTDLPVLRMA